ncbi:FtsK/SpoIIIE domain-containing protein [Lysinibacter sp. HNR]|uniref:FtsK/SpoIIIE domain-containing protein n=1 Tax=Lysinibacter sp. HNR TaxID=3031408 RepID=UPI002435C34B|nr:FtsK/SpoIIIE domain-containing protein [Lysinibacter sp. HNR]WGD36754.1 FtsK/SpoIIIE domain-containing protein [Lysinibacter sp. HNR]
MRVEHPRLRAQNVLLSASVTNTISDVAVCLVQNSPESYVNARQAIAQLAPLALRVRYPGDNNTYVLDPGAPIGRSGLRSGCWVQPQPDNQKLANDIRVDPIVATLTVENGIQSGITFSLVRGENTIGRDPQARIYLHDSSVSRRHATVMITDTVTIVDHQSANGVIVDNHKIASSAPLQGQHRILLGSTRVTIFVMPHYDAATPVYSSVLQDGGHMRSPRIEPRFERGEIHLPHPPQLPEPSKFSFIALIVPLIMGVTLYLATGNPMSLLFVILSPLFLVGSYIDTRVILRRKNRAQAQQFYEAIDRVEQRLEQLRAQEAQIRSTETQSSSEVMTAVVKRNQLLWTRRPEHRAFCEVRLGLGMQPSRMRVQPPKRNGELVEPEHWSEIERIVDKYSRIATVPVVERLSVCGALGVAGEGLRSWGCARSIVLQLAGLHSPADMVITCLNGLSGRRAAVDWEWLSWLPHVDSPYSPLRNTRSKNIRLDNTSCVAPEEGEPRRGEFHPSNDVQSAQQLLADLEELLETRRTHSGTPRTVRSHLNASIGAAHFREDSVSELPATPVVVVLVLFSQGVGEAAKSLELGRLTALIDAGADFGIYFIWVAERLEQLPAQCRTYVHIEEQGGHVGYVRTGEVVALERVDTVEVLEASLTAIRLSSVSDVGSQLLDESDLPNAVNYRDLVEHDVLAGSSHVMMSWLASDSLVSRWVPGEERAAQALTAVVGLAAEGPISLDLRAHGPHALVGGTTGSGKSEFLQTWIMSLAAHHSPDRLTFLLIDYKGGAAFAECVKLPHTVGLVTDLNQHLVRRALTSLRAELVHRERLLNSRGAKDLAALETRGDVMTPPILMIVIDELAALVAEMPEFISGIVDVAQRGRSLGVHLVMATQRPADVISDSLRANTNLRIALRVADRADSADIVGTEDAALFNLDTPGRGAVRIGPGQLIHFQTGYLGSRSGRASTRPAIRIENLGFGATKAWKTSLKPSSPGGALERVSAQRDIEKLLENILCAYTKASLTPPRRPWLEPLPSMVALERLPSIPERGIVIGMADEPQRQRQNPYSIDLDTVGGVAIVGGGGSGKSTALRTMAIAITRTVRDDPTDIYILDYEGGALDSLTTLPTVGSVIPGRDDARLRRLFRELIAQLRQRQHRYSRLRAGTLTEYRSHSEEEHEHRIVLLIDGLGAMRQRYELVAGDNPYRSFAALLAEGRQVGIHCFFTLDRLEDIDRALNANIQQQIILRAGVDSDSGAVKRTLGAPKGMSQGRALVRKRSEGSEMHEVQLAIYGGTESLLAQSTRIEELGERLVARGVTPVPEIMTLPTSVVRTELPTTHDGRLVVGLDDLTLQPASISDTGLFTVMGQQGSGRSTAIETIYLNRCVKNPQANTFLLSTRSTRLHNLPWTEECRSINGVENLAHKLVTRLSGGPAAHGAGVGLYEGDTIFGSALQPPRQSESNAQGSENNTWASGDNSEQRPGEKRERVSGKNSVSENLQNSSQIFIVIDDVAELEGTPADGAVSQLLKVARSSGAHTVIMCDPNTVSQSWGVHAQLKSVRNGVFLQPDEDDAPNPLRIQTNRIKRSDFPPGRGYLVESGQSSLIQVALPR